MNRFWAVDKALQSLLLLLSGYGWLTTLILAPFKVSRFGIRFQDGLDDHPSS